MEDLEHINVIEEIVSGMKETPGPLLEILHEVQGRLGYISPDFVPIIAESLNISRAEVHGVISFYHYFRTTPGSRHRIQICRAEACQAMGSRLLEKHAKTSLGIDYHQITADGSITLEPVYCLGNCACSPAVRIDNKIHANVSTEIFDSLIDDLTRIPLKVIN